MKDVVLSVGLILLLGRAGSGGRLEGIVEKYLREALNRPALVRVRVKTGPAWGAVTGRIRVLEARVQGFSVDRFQFQVGKLSLLAGRVDDFRVHANDLEIGGIPIHRLEIELRGLAYDLPEAAFRDRILLSERGGGEFLAELTEGNLTQWACRKLGEGVQIELRAGRVLARGEASLGGILPLSWEASGLLSVEGGNRLLWNPDQIQVGGVEARENAPGLPFAGGFELLRLDRDMNLGVKLELKQVLVKGDRVRLSGSVLIKR